jgi:hypothetical protein
MPKDSLIRTNSYLKDPKIRETLLARAVVSSTAIEGVHLDYGELEESPSISKDIRSSESQR